MGFNSLEQAHALVTIDPVVKGDFFLDALHICLRDIRDVDYFASEVQFALRFAVFGLLSFAHFPVLTNAEYLFHIHSIISYFPRQSSFLLSLCLAGLSATLWGQVDFTLLLLTLFSVQVTE